MKDDGGANRTLQIRILSTDLTGLCSHTLRVGCISPWAVSADEWGARVCITDVNGFEEEGQALLRLPARR